MFVQVQSTGPVYPTSTRASTPADSAFWLPQFHAVLGLNQHRIFFAIFGLFTGNHYSSTAKTGRENAICIVMQSTVIGYRSTTLSRRDQDLPRLNRRNSERLVRKFRFFRRLGRGSDKISTLQRRSLFGHEGESVFRPAFPPIKGGPGTVGAHVFFGPTFVTSAPL